MTNELKKVAESLSIKSQTETWPVPPESKQEFVSKAHDLALGTLQRSLVGRSFCYRYQKRPNRNLSKVLGELPNLQPGERYIFTSPFKVIFTLREKEKKGGREQVMIRSAVFLRAKRMSQNPFCSPFL